MKPNKILVLVLLASFCTIPSFAADTLALNKRTAAVETTSPERVKELTNRLEEIKAMNTESMTRTEKRTLRKEVRAIEKEMDRSGGGLYISAGAIIIIILLIILL